MAYTVNWSTKVVTIPQADLTFVSAGIYELDVVTFWQAIHDIQDGADGIAYIDIMQSNAPVVLSGVTYARTVEVINGYTIEFEDGQYQVNLTGANNNILDARVQNQVSINSQNSAGLISGGFTDAHEATLNAVQTLVDELHKLQGLDAANPMTVTKTQRTVGGITIDITGDGITTSTATRQ